MDSIKDVKGKVSSTRIIMYLLFAVTTGVTISCTIMFFMALLNGKIEFCPYIIGFNTAAGIPLLGTLILKLKQSKLELNGYSLAQPKEENQNEGE